MTLAAGQLAADLAAYARQRTSRIRKLMMTRGIGCSVRTSASTAVTRVTVYRPSDAKRAEWALGDLPARSIEIVVKVDA